VSPAADLLSQAHDRERRMDQLARDRAALWNVITATVTAMKAIDREETRLLGEAQDLRDLARQANAADRLPVRRMAS
jgi:hypothetical protein